MTATPLLTVRGLEAGYAPGRAVLVDVDFSATAGEQVSVLGPNGGGKTTLFRALLSELPYRRGEVELSSRVAYVPQTDRTRLDFPVDALGVALMGTYASLPWYRRVGAAQRSTAEEALARVGLADEARTPFGALSGGQRQRVLLARALAQEANVLLLDEPLSGVDKPSTDLILALLDQLRADGAAVLIATHDIRQARRSDKVLCLNHRQTAFGPPEEALSGATLEATYGGELILLPDGGRAIAVQHHQH
jgi:manganese/iron transport system ATP-binding protein/manganese/zinc/iron transport system ATP- binding protein